MAAEGNCPQERLQHMFVAHGERKVHSAVILFARPLQPRNKALSKNPILYRGQPSNVGAALARVAWMKTALHRGW